VQTRLRSLASRGVSQSNINATKLKSFEIPLPPINEQKRIVEILRTVDNKIRAESQRLSAFSVVFDSLSRDLASGSRTLDQTTVAQEHNGARS